MMPANLEAPTLLVRHADLPRWNEDSAYKARCPVCKDGPLLIARHPVTLNLLRTDRCLACGQSVQYIDKAINGEPLAPFDTASNYALASYVCGILMGLASAMRGSERQIHAAELDHVAALIGDHFKLDHPAVLELIKRMRAGD